MRISDWSSDVCSSDLGIVAAVLGDRRQANQMTQKWESGRLQLSWRHAMDLRFELGEHRAEIPFPYQAIEPQERHDGIGKIGRSASRAKVCQHVTFKVFTGEINKKKTINSK